MITKHNWEDDIIINNLSDSIEQKVSDSDYDNYLNSIQSKSNIFDTYPDTDSTDDCFADDWIDKL